MLLRPFIRPVADPELVDDGDGSHGWEVVAAPGHADGQLTLLRDGVLIAADHLLDADHADGRALAREPPRPARRLPRLAAAARSSSRPTVAYGGHGDVDHATRSAGRRS